MTTARVIICPACGAKNRVAVDKIQAGYAPRCGRCRSALPLETAPVVVTDATFGAQVERSALPVLVDFWAAWCGPCRMIAPIIDHLAGDMAGRVRFAKLDIDANPRTADRFGVASIPTLLIMKDGREVDRIVGVAPASEIARRLDAVAR